MPKRKTIVKVASRLPISATYIKKYEDLTKSLNIQKDQITILQQSVQELEEKNKILNIDIKKLQGYDKRLELVWPAKPEDIIKADWEKSIPEKVIKKSKPPLIINWVIPPMGPVSGGHADIFRTISFLESQGHQCNVYFYDNLKNSSLKTIKKTLQNYPQIKSKLFYNENNMVDCDAIFATNWHSAYPVFNFKGKGKKYYYVQDFEPYFDPVGSYSVLAENTYRFKLKGITLGKWLAEKLIKEYGMECEYFELGFNPKEYYLTNPKPRKKIIFYARPVTPRRAFEIGILALEIFHKTHPEYEINFIGWDTTRFKIPFPYKNLGILQPTELNKLYNQSAVGLVLSLTNMSLLPLEIMACGCGAVVNDSRNTRMVEFSGQIKYSTTSPKSLAKALHEEIERLNETKIIKMVDYCQQFEWDKSNKIIENILLKDLIN